MLSNSSSFHSHRVVTDFVESYRTQAVPAANVHRRQAHSSLTDDTDFLVFGKRLSLICLLPNLVPTLRRIKGSQRGRGGPVLPQRLAVDRILPCLSYTEILCRPIFFANRHFIYVLQKVINLVKGQASHDQSVRLKNDYERIRQRSAVENSRQRN